MSELHETRLFRPEDAAQIEQVFQASVTQLGPRFYSEAQVKAWAAHGPNVSQILDRNKDGRITFVATDIKQEVLAYGELEPDGHIEHLYARPDAAARDIVSALYDRLEVNAKELGIQTLYTEASEAARRFFLKKEYVDQGRQDFVIQNISIYNYAMTKSLE